MDDRPEGSAALDEFGTRLQELVGRFDPERAARILALRAHLQRADDEAPESEGLAESDRRLNFFLTEARIILDNDEVFRQLFDAEPGQMVSFASAAE